VRRPTIAWRAVVARAAPLPRRATLAAGIALLAWLAACGAPTQAPPRYPLVLHGGRVMDPETGLDGIRDVAIAAGRVAAISPAPLRGAEIVDVSGRVVAPGFIDLHSHAQTPLGQRFQVRDGVTTALELESGTYPVEALGVHPPLDFAERSRIHFGSSVGHAWIRARILEGDGAASGIDDAAARLLRDGTRAGLDGPAFTQPLDAAQLQRLRRDLARGLDDGGLGIGLLLDYMSEAVGDDELRAIFELAGERQAPIFVHIRRGVAGDPAGLVEVIELAGETGAPLHVCHVQANAMSAIDDFLRRIREARDAGLRITTESFPYNAGSTSISAAVFDRDWQRIFGISYADVEWAASGERFDAAMWREYREKHPEGAVIHHYNREAWTRVATTAPDVLVASDGLPVLSPDVKAPPFGIGTFSRILGRYVREQRSLTLMDALAKMTLGPARVLEGWAPAFRRKGRVQVGADADLTVFDPERVVDHATFADPYRPSTGIDHVIVAGSFAVRDGVLLEGVTPGRRLLAVDRR
jgi:cytosine/adenosine deaminase-related metal-dependent hydrolase